MVTPESTMIAREADGRWTKGVSPNPGGRPKGLAGYIRERTNDGQELVDFVLSVVRGEDIDDEKPSVKVRMQAAQWLADRGWGRPVQGVVHAGQIVHRWDVLADLSLEDVKALALAYRALQEQKAKAIEGDVIEGESHPVDVLESDVDAGDEAT